MDTKLLGILSTSLLSPGAEQQLLLDLYNKTIPPAPHFYTVAEHLLRPQTPPAVLYVLQTLLFFCRMAP
jgi:hypothetical protein